MANSALSIGVWVPLFPLEGSGCKKLYMGNYCNHIRDKQFCLLLAFSYSMLLWPSFCLAHSKLLSLKIPRFLNLKPYCLRSWLLVLLRGNVWSLLFPHHTLGIFYLRINEKVSQSGNLIFLTFSILNCTFLIFSMGNQVSEEFLLWLSSPCPFSLWFFHCSSYHHGSFTIALITVALSP